MNARFFLSVCLVPFALAACASDDGPPRGCPQVANLRDLERVEDHGRDAIDPSTLVAVALMKKIDGTCKYKEKGVEVKFDLSMAAEKGPRLGSGQASFPFFVSLITPEDKVRAKEMMTASFAFPSMGKLLRRGKLCAFSCRLRKRRTLGLTAFLSASN
jgi:hypothetical protein